MVDPIDDIARQARQGSVAAIIQILNDKLADASVRTRAVFQHGILQLLCEAASPEQLEQDPLVNRIRQILESISPRNIRRVKINSRLVQEQQLLWLEEVARDPAHLLWAEEIILTRPTLLTQISEDMKARRVDAEKAELIKSRSVRQVREDRQFWRGIIGGAGLSVFLLLVGWAVWGWLGSRLNDPSQAKTQPTASSTPTPSPVASTPPTPPPKPVVTPQPKDPFVEAVRIAEQTSIAGTKARSTSEWLSLATRWQQASDLMAQVPVQDARRKTAADRAVAYRKNSEAALQKAKKPGRN